MNYIYVGAACLAIGFFIGYVVCWRNPPNSLLQKLGKKIEQ